MPCDLKTLATDGRFRICSDSQLRDLTCLMGVLAKRNRRREAKLIYKRIAVLIHCRGVAGKKPYFSLDDGSTCRLAGDGKHLFFTPSGLSAATYRDHYDLANRDLNAIDARRFPRSLDKFQEPERFCSRTRIGMPLCPDTRFFDKDDDGEISREAIDSALKVVA